MERVYFCITLPPLTFHSYNLYKVTPGWKASGEKFSDKSAPSGRNIYTCLLRGRGAFPCFFKVSMVYGRPETSNCESNLSRRWYRAKILSLRFFEIIEVSKPPFRNDTHSTHVELGFRNGHEQTRKIHRAFSANRDERKSRRDYFRRDRKWE